MRAQKLVVATVWMAAVAGRVLANPGRWRISGYLPTWTTRAVLTSGLPTYRKRSPPGYSGEWASRSFGWIRDLEHRYRKRDAADSVGGRRPQRDQTSVGSWHPLSGSPRDDEGDVVRRGRPHPPLLDGLLDRADDDL